MSGRNVVWLSPSATTFSCLCERCLDAGRASGLLFGEAVAFARVRGELSPAAAALTVACARGHELVLRRSTRPESLPPRDGRQLQLV
jgi:hypothetical protein